MCGSCGVLDKNAAKNGIIIPSSAIRDEGTSFHYMKPSREIILDAKVVSLIKSCLNELGIKYSIGKTWTTDAFYRETPRKVNSRREEGCISVEMETSAMSAVAKFRKVNFGAIFYTGDDITGDVWNVDKLNCKNSRERLFDIALEIAYRMSKFNFSV
ncbi:MAG: nucleoside phosphorylase [Candidatus Delongbacteria bacterium]|nr:nucleoside phosphorylase [Candidatus Delongbacteria bacterium]MBN2833691.1 nucleoside phosphorylase [Candidatus Delongbacteria bacterium]